MIYKADATSDSSSFLFPLPLFLPLPHSFLPFPLPSFFVQHERTMRLRVAKPPAQRKSLSSHWSDS